MFHQVQHKWCGFNLLRKENFHLKLNSYHIHIGIIIFHWEIVISKRMHVHLNSWWCTHDKTKYQLSLYLIVHFIIYYSLTFIIAHLPTLGHLFSCLIYIKGIEHKTWILTSFNLKFSHWKFYHYIIKIQVSN